MATQGAYRKRVAQQIAQYQEVESIHDLPPIFHYWSNRYVLPKLEEVMGADSIVDFYAVHICERIERVKSSPAKIVSLGAGDAELEVQIAAALLAEGVRNFVLECAELSPALIERAGRRIQEAGVGEHVRTAAVDLNRWPGAHGCTAVIANHVLHHVVELEALFEGIVRAIGAQGVFLTADMIGRNGHMRWPEALAIIDLLWPTLPPALRYDRVAGKVREKFNNEDVSVRGFEGIRAQDILPLLIERFKFEKFLGFGSLPDVFVDRLLGANFSIDRGEHLSFIDRLEQLNEALIGLGVLKPTMMFAVLSNSFAAPARVWRSLTPQFCVRGGATQNTLWAPRAERRFTFESGSPATAALRAGWSYPEGWGVWMKEQKAEVVLTLPPELLAAGGALEVIVEATAFLPRARAQREFLIAAGGRNAGWFTFKRSEVQCSHVISVPQHACAHGALSLVFTALDTFSPAEDGSADTRSLGLGLVGIKVRSPGLPLCGNPA